MATTHLTTAEELLLLGNVEKLELIEGVLCEVSPSGGKSAAIAFVIGGYLFDYARKTHCGFFTTSEGGFVLATNPDTVVAPDIGFVRAGRFPGGIPESFIPGPPDFAVEVISPSDRAADISRKQALYARFEIPLVWWVDPERRTVAVHRPGAPGRLIDETGTLSGEDVLPGFELPLNLIFRD